MRACSTTWRLAQANSLGCATGRPPERPIQSPERRRAETPTVMSPESSRRSATSSPPRCGPRRRLRIRAPRLAPIASLGDSIAVSGCCLTVVEHDGDVVAFDAVPETLEPPTPSSELRPAGGSTSRTGCCSRAKPLRRTTSSRATSTAWGGRPPASREEQRRPPRRPHAAGAAAVALVEKSSSQSPGGLHESPVAALTDDGFEVVAHPAHPGGRHPRRTRTPVDLVNLETDVLARPCRAAALQPLA